MSSLYTRSKEFTRNRKSQSDSPPASPSPTAKTLRHERLSRLESGGSNPTSSDAHSDRASARARREAREARLASLTSRVEEDSSRDYKKLYESALTENQKLKTKLQEAQLELADIKAKLEKMAQQKQEKTSDRSSVLEVEKRESAETMYSAEEVPFSSTFRSFSQRARAGNGGRAANAVSPQT